MKLKIEFVDGSLSPTHSLTPRYATIGAAGMDLCARLNIPITLPPGGRMLVPTGFKIEIPYGYEAQIRPRSGLALKHGITVLNSPGTIDSDYRGEVGVILINHGEQPFTIEPGSRIAQMVIARVEMTELVLGEVGESERGEGGFGSTGLEVRAGVNQDIVEFLQQDPPIGQIVWGSNEKTVVGVAYDISKRQVISEITKDGEFNGVR